MCRAVPVLVYPPISYFDAVLFNIQKIACWQYASQEAYRIDCKQSVPQGASCTPGASVPAPAQQKHRLLAEQVPEPPRRVQPERASPGVEGKRAFHLDADRDAQVAEILDGAEMDVGGVVPSVRQIVGLWHAAAEHEQQPDAPMAEIGERHHRVAADPQHVLE